jgi:hypothetical protein
MKKILHIFTVFLISACNQQLSSGYSPEANAGTPTTAISGVAFDAADEPPIVLNREGTLEVRPISGLSYETSPASVSVYKGTTN